MLGQDAICLKVQFIHLNFIHIFAQLNLKNLLKQAKFSNLQISLTDKDPTDKEANGKQDRKTRLVIKRKYKKPVMLDYKKAHFLTSLKNTQVQYVSAWHLYQYFDNQATKAKMVVHTGS